MTFGFGKDVIIFTIYSFGDAGLSLRRETRSQHAVYAIVQHLWGRKNKHVSFNTSFIPDDLCAENCRRKSHSTEAHDSITLWAVVCLFGHAHNVLRYFNLMCSWWSTDLTAFLLFEFPCCAAQNDVIYASLPRTRNKIPPFFGKNVGVTMDLLGLKSQSWEAPAHHVHLFTRHSTKLLHDQKLLHTKWPER